MQDKLCSQSSRATDEPLSATALDDVVAWVAVEDRAAWGRDAFAHAPPDLQAWVAGWEQRLPGLRAAGLKHTGRCEDPLELLFADVTRGRLWRRSVADTRALEALDLAAALEGELVGATALEAPIFLVCTHGKRDVCCARLGAPVYAALVEAVGLARVWQSTHVGGHRFAPNVVVLPAGITYGRVEADEVDALVAAASEGRIYRLDRYRGRNQYPAPAQAAEHALRQRFGLLTLRDVALVECNRQGRDQAVCRMSVAGHGEHELTLSRVQDDVERLKSCDAWPPKRLFRWQPQ